MLSRNEPQPSSHQPIRRLAGGFGKLYGPYLGAVAASAPPSGGCTTPALRCTDCRGPPDVLVGPVALGLGTSAPPSTGPRVCVIGAGSSGIAVVKALADRGIPFDCFEMSDRVGGNWAFRNPNGRSATYRSLHIT